MQKQVTLIAVCGICVCCIFIYLIDTSSTTWMLKTKSTRFKISPMTNDTTSFSSIVTTSFDISEPASCKPSKNVVYIKTHKTGSTTLATILYRFGYHRNLSFLFSSKQRLGHFRHKPMTQRSLPELYPPIGVSYGDYEKYKFDISAGHVIYNRAIFELLIHEKSKYVTILREPVRQFASYFNFFNFRRRYMNNTNISSSDPFAYLNEFVSNPSKYTNATHSDVNSRTRQNPQFFDLGLPASKMSDRSFINQSISRLDRDFDLVLFTEYLDESLILLKKQFCWQMEDILYFKMNIRHTDPIRVPEKLAGKIRQWNHGDVLLYDHFNQTLWRKVAEYGPRFKTDLEAFKKRLENLKADCVDGYDDVNSRIVKVLKSDASVLCQRLNEDIYSWFKQIIKRQKFSPYKEPHSASTNASSNLASEENTNNTSTTTKKRLKHRPSSNGRLRTLLPDLQRPHRWKSE